MRRWNRVNTGIIANEMRGYRVPLVTGAGEEDLAARSPITLTTIIFAAV